MERFDFPTGGMCLAAGVAGPVYIMMCGVADLLLAPARATPWTDIVTFLGIVLMSSTLTAFFGIFVAILPIWGGTVLMHSLSWQFELARHKLCWAAAGAALPVPFVWLAGLGAAPTAPSIAFVLTGAACAAICHTARPQTAS